MAEQLRVFFCQVHVGGMLRVKGGGAQTSISPPTTTTTHPPPAPYPPTHQICAKQYKTAAEMDEHLSSYDHHHRKRLAETRAMLADRTRAERGRKERRREEREMARLAEQ